MKTIQFKLSAGMLENGSDGKLIRKAVSAVVELPFSEENLRHAEASALPGTVQIVEKEEQDVQRDSAMECICLIDRATGNPYVVYVEKGNLMMEVL